MFCVATTTGTMFWILSTAVNPAKPPNNARATPQARYALPLLLRLKFFRHGAGSVTSLLVFFEVKFIPCMCSSKLEGKERRYDVFVFCKDFTKFQKNCELERTFSPIFGTKSSFPFVIYSYTPCALKQNTILQGFMFSTTFKT